MNQVSARLLIAFVVGIFVSGWLGCEEESRPVAQAAPLAAQAVPAPLPPPPVRKNLPRSGDWKRVEALIGEQKFDEARTLVQKIRAAAQSAQNGEEWTEALIKETQLSLGLSGYETAVRTLRREAWPKDALSQVALELYYVHSLVQYLQAYSWEINQRERVDSKGEVDLKAWTREQIYGEALSAYTRLWNGRLALSQAKLGLLGDVVHASTYPEDVRGTLRDELSYLTVELLTNTMFWRPEESSELYRLDWKALLELGGRDAIAPNDGKVHPLVRAIAVLDDLERFHMQQGPGHKEAALEARLSRVRRLHQSFTDAAEREQLIGHLERTLATYRDKPWWSMGMATLAELLRDGSHDLVRAHAAASEGQRVYPDSPGGQRCQYIKKLLEAPDFQLQAMATDGQNKRSLQVTHKNLERLHFRAYPLDLLGRIESAQDYNLLLGPSEIAALVKKSKPSAEWVAELPQTPDYKSHKTFVTPPLKQNGFYAVVASLKPDFSEKGNRVFGTNLILTDLVVVTRQHDTQLEITVVASPSGQPVAGANVSVYLQNYNRKHQRVGSERTDDKGVVKLRQADGQSVYVVAQNGRDITVDRNTFYLYRGYEQSEVHAALVYTDRSIYRPQQKVLYKVVAYRGKQDEGRLQVAPKARLTVVLLDANHQEVAQQTVTSNDFGTAAGEFAIPAGRLLGNWRIEVRGNHTGGAQLRVEEYKRPTFEVSFKDPEQPLRLNKPATLVGEARYFFGLPVTAGQIHYRVSREPVYPWWWFMWGFGGGGERGQTVASGRVPLSADGSFKIDFTPAADERHGAANKAVSYRYQVKADLTDEGGETRSAERGFRLGFVSIEATIESEQGFVAGPGGTLSVRRASLDGVPRPGEGRYRIVAIKQPGQPLLPADQPIPEPPSAEKPPYRTPGDKLRPRWQTDYSPEAMLGRFPDGGEKQSGKLTHDAKGQAVLQLPSLPAGAYRLRYETTDEFGAKAEAWKDFLVAGVDKGRGAATAMPPAVPLALPLILRADKERLAVGETAKLLVGSGLPDQAVMLELFRAGKLLRRTIHRTTTIVELPIGEEDRGGLGVIAWTVRDHQYVAQHLTLQVPWTNKELRLEFATFRDMLRPGARETWRVIVKSPSGEALARGMAELLAYMYDRSLEVFAPHAPPNPLSLFPYRGGFTQSRSSVGAAPVFWVHNQLPSPPAPPPLHGAQLVFYDSYSIGGLGMRGYGQAFGGMLATRAQGMPVSVAPAAPPPPPSADAPAQQPGEPLAEAEKAERKEESRSNTTPAARAKSREANAAAAEPAGAVRSNFAETAFFLPSLISDDNGAAVLEFTVPDSVTSWNVFVHALTRDLRSGVLKKETRSVKELMVRPYLPRFFREADSAQLKVMVNNARDKGGAPLSGNLRLEIFDPETQENLLPLFQIKAAQQPFTVEAGKSTTLTFPLSAPRRVGVYAFKVVASAADLSDGELRPLPVLPSRMHLAESRFVTLKDRDRRTMSFAELKKNDDPTRTQDQLVVTLDNQLFYTVLKALPYLVSYPYECVEQTLNRFLSTGIVSSIFAQYPAVAKMAKEFSERPTQLERFDAPDANRKMTLEESPWVQESQGGRKSSEPLINVLDPRIARAQRDSALSRLRKSQTSLGGFPWFPGGPPSPFMTLYIMNGFAKAAEFHVDVPKDVVQRGWQYLARHYREHYITCLKKDHCDAEFLTLLNYVATSYLDASWTGDALTAQERQDILNYSFRRWKSHSPYLKAMLSLTLKRMNRQKDAQLVWASVMDSAKTAPDQGVFWAQEDRSWLWYNDTIESHAFALRTLMELDPQNEKKDGLVLWLLLNKKLNQWKSTRATAEVIYSLTHYLKREGALGVREEATVSVGEKAELYRENFVFTPDKYVGKTQIVLPGAKIAQNPVAASSISVEKATKGYMFASATWHYSTDRLPTQGQGDFFRVERTYFKRELDAKSGGKDFVLRPLAEGETLHPGDELEVHLSLRSKHEAEYVHLRDPRAAGLEPDSNVSRYKWDLGLIYYEEVRDSGMNFFFEKLPVGEYTFKYRLRCNLSGSFRAGPATVQSMYAPEFAAFSAGHVINIAGESKN